MPSAARDERARVVLARELGRLDPYSFWSVPTEPSSEGDMVVAGVTGVFLVRACSLPGALTVDGRRATIDGVRLPGVRALRAERKRLSAKLSAASVFSTVEPVVCLTVATAGGPRSVRGVRVVPLTYVARDLSGRARVLPPTRAQRAARVLGMQLAGDRKRHFVR
jgi:hypothetical protein